jgi:hypothetical protein
MIMPYNVINITYQGQSKKEKKENDNICLVLSRTFVKKNMIISKSQLSQLSLALSLSPLAVAREGASH